MNSNSLQTISYSFPRTKDEFNSQINEGVNQDKQTKGLNFYQTMTEIIIFFENEDKSMFPSEDEDDDMFSSRKAFKYGWYDLITCTEHLMKNYDIILKEYSFYIINRVSQRNFNQEIEENQLNQFFTYLKQTQILCNIIFEGLYKGKQIPTNLKYKHSYFMDQINTSLNEINRAKSSVRKNYLLHRFFYAAKTKLIEYKYPVFLQVITAMYVLKK